MNRHRLVAPSHSRSHEVTRFSYNPPVILAGRGAVSELDAELAEAGVDSAIVVCNRSIETTPRVIEPIIEALGDRFAGLFSAATAQKRLKTAWEAAQMASNKGATGIVGVGSGSALDVATVASGLVNSGRSFDAVRDHFRTHRRIPLEHMPVSLVTIPTTLAGAELSHGAGITANLHDTESMELVGGISDPKLRPWAVLYDPELVEATPASILRASAMNGFNKGLEALYSPAATPVTDATAKRGLGILLEWLPTLRESAPDVEAIDAILEGSLLVQYGVSRSDATGLSVIHAFGHGVTATAPVQQGIVHAIVTPAVLRVLFDRGDCRQELLAETFGVGSAEGVIETIETLRADLDLPTRFGEVSVLDRSMLPAIAEATAQDHLIDNLPPDVTLTVDDIHGILKASW